MGTNMERLGALLAGRMKNTAAAAVPNTIELGVIRSNMALRTDSIRADIPRGMYMVNLALTGTTNSTHTTLNHVHALPDRMRGLRSGDRVLVAWAGNEPIVIAVVVSS